MTCAVSWGRRSSIRSPGSTRRIPGASRLVVAAVYELADGPTPTISVQLGTLSFRRLLFGYYRATYEIREGEQAIAVISVGRSDNPR